MVENECYRWPSWLDDFLNCLGGGGLFGRRQATHLPSPTTNNPDIPPPDIWTSYEMTTSDGECSSLTISIFRKIGDCGQSMRKLKCKYWLTNKMNEWTTIPLNITSLCCISMLFHLISMFTFQFSKFFFSFSG